jgi:hypothetical protein
LTMKAQLQGIESGALLSYTITYINLGFVAAEALVITVAVPAYATFVAALSTPGWECPQGIDAGALCFYQIARLEPHQPGELVFVVTLKEELTEGTVIYNQASIGTTGDEQEITLANNIDAVTVTTSAPTSLADEAEPVRPQWYQLFLPIVQREE